MVVQNDWMRALSTLDATRPLDPRRPASRSRFPNTQDVYWVPVLAWTMVPFGDCCQRAISSASTTSSERTWSAIDQRKTIRLNVSKAA